MKKVSAIFLTAVFTLPAFCGTLVYHNAQKEKKILSEVDIVAIDKNIITFEIGKTTRTLPLRSVLKYYNTDINMNLIFDDNTSDYGVFATNIKLPANKKGITTRKGGKRGGKQVNKITMDYTVNIKYEKNKRRAIKFPYFYLYVLVANSNQSGTSLYCFHYPEAAKIKSAKNYNEALMLEKALSSDRQNITADYILSGRGVKSGSRMATFELKGIGNREIVAYHVVVWGKDDIVFTENRILNHNYNLSKNWYIHARNNK